ncbi:hypothetical protein L7F22_009138 [Adiantum nelumboides]|nr:hypothetical protein [Adiantum nelumboides]
MASASASASREFVKANNIEDLHEVGDNSPLKGFLRKARAKRKVGLEEVPEEIASTSCGFPKKMEDKAESTKGRVLLAASAASKLWERSLLIPKVEDCELTLPEMREANNVPVLNITDLSEITPRFALEGKVLNNYGTFKMSDPKFPMYFKVNIVDKQSSDTITIVGSVLINQFVQILPVVQSENLESKSGSTRGELIVADGLTSSDRATLTFVTDQKEDYNNLLKEIDCGKLVMRVARNIGAFMGRKNTLSVMDLTVLVPVRSKRMQAELTAAFEAQVKTFGYGKEIAVVLSFVNVNSVLIERVCCVCKSNKVHKVRGGEHCDVRDKKTKVMEIPKLQERIFLYDDSVVHAQLTGHIVDRVLHLEKSFQQLYACSVLETRETLARASRTGTFKVNIAGHVIGFTEKKT